MDRTNAGADDDYYISLYERHATGRADRRKRHGKSLRRTFRLKQKSTVPDKHQGFDASRALDKSNQLRFCAAAIFAVFAVYEVFALRTALRRDGQSRSFHHSTKSSGPSVTLKTLSPIPAQAPPTLAAPVRENAVTDVSQTSVQNVQQSPSAESTTGKLAAHPLAHGDQKSDVKTPVRIQMPEAIDNTHPSNSSGKHEQLDEKSTGHAQSRRMPNPPPMQSFEETKSELRESRIGSSSELSFTSADSETFEDSPADAVIGGIEQMAPKNPSRSRPVKRRISRKNGGSTIVKIEGGAHHDPPDQNGESQSKNNESFWEWFQESKDSEKAGASSVGCPAESDRICKMFYKIIHKYKIRSVYDASCSKNVAWMPPVLRKLGNELWGFKYSCGESGPASPQVSRDVIGDIDCVQLDSRQWWIEGFPEGTELLFAWDVLPHTAYGRVWKFFANARKQNVRFVLVDNYPGISNDPSPRRMFLNLRKHPFRFPAAKEVVQNVTEPGETDKRQLLLYETAELPIT